MSAQRLRDAASEVRRTTDQYPPGVGQALADWLELVAAWRDEGLGLMPDGNLTDAWLDIEQQAKVLADLILSAVTHGRTATANGKEESDG